MPLSSSVFRRIEKIVGKENCSCAREDLLCYAYDATHHVYYPDAVVFPKDAQEVSAVLRLANQEGFSVTPRGAGSGMTGGSLPTSGGVVLVMTRLNRILSIDTDNLIAVAESGVVTGVFQKAVADVGLFYPPDPSSAAYSTLGGNAAECAGGPKAVKYGVTRDYVMGLEVVLPTGEIIRTGGQTKKGVVGFDLTRLIVGSEGTLGVVTQLILRLLPRPETVKTMTAVYDRMERAAETITEIIRQGIIPSTIEFMDNASLRCVAEHIPEGLAADADAMLIIEADGSPAEVDYQMGRMESLCRRFGALKVRAARTPGEVESLWRGRKSISPALFKYGPDKINEDIVVPRSRIPDMIKKIKELRRKTGLMMVSFGHAGDGNIHFNIMLDRKDPVQLARANQAVSELFDYTLELGGTLSGEHGVGITKSAYMAREIPPEAVALMRRLKAAFDPAGVLNPGKMLL